MLRSSLLLIALSSFALAACSSSDDTDNNGDRTQEGPGLNEAFEPCIETRTSIGLDDETSLGLTVREAFEIAEGEHQATLRFHDDSETGLTLSIEGEPFEIELVERERNTNSGSGEGPAIELAEACNDSLVAKVKASFKTDDESFDEAWDDLQLSFSKVMDSARVDGRRALDFESLGGSYMPNELPSSDYDRIVQPSVSLTIEEGRFSGSITYLAEKTEGEGDDGTVSAANITAASWDRALESQ